MRTARIAAIAALLTGLVLAPAVAPAPAVAGGGCHLIGDGSVHTEGTATVVRMDICSFAPTVARVPVGTEVRFLNTSQLIHAVAGERGEWGSANDLRPGEETSRRFTEPGVYPFSCPIHPGMVGAVVVGDAAPDAAGGTGSTGDAGAGTGQAGADGTVGAAANRDDGPLGLAGPIAAAALVAGLGLGLAAGLVVARRRDTGPRAETITGTITR